MTMNYDVAETLIPNYEHDEEANWFETINVRDQSPLDHIFTSLHENDIQKFVKLLDEEDAPLNSLHCDLRCSILMRTLAISNGGDFTKHVLSHNVNIHLKDEYGNAPIHVAAQFASVEIIGLLIEAGCELEEADESGDLPLHIAAYNGRPEVVNILLERGADVHALNSCGMSAIQMATSTPPSCLDTLNMLMSWGCCVNPLRCDTQSALIQAMWNNDSSVVALLLSNNADVNCSNRSGFTALDVAIQQENFDAMLRLLSINAQVYTTGDDMSTRISLFARSLLITSCPRVCRLFVNGGALSSREGWLFDNMPSNIAENASTMCILKNFRETIPTLRDLCLISIRETLSLTGKFQEAINDLDLPKP